MKIKGFIRLFSGRIGNWDIGISKLVKDTGNDITSSGMSPDDFPFFAGATFLNRASAPFRVNVSGQVVMNRATIKSNTTGKRIVIDGTNNNIIFYSQSDAYYLLIDTNATNSPHLTITGEIGWMTMDSKNLMVSNNSNNNRFSYDISDTYLNILLRNLGSTGYYDGLQGGRDWKQVYIDINSGQIGRGN